jgi:hypothetical protein
VSSAAGAASAAKVASALGRGPGAFTAGSIGLAANGVSRVLGALKQDLSFQHATGILDSLLASQKEVLRSRRADIKAVIDADIAERLRLGCN